MHKSLALTILLSIGTIGVAPTESARAESEPPSCGMGDARAMFEVLPVPVLVMRPRGIDGPRLLDSLSRCQYRLFRDGETFTFSEDDVIVGGVSYLYDYAQLGVTRQAAIAEIESTTDRVCLAETMPDGTIGECVEQLLMHSAYKNVMSVTFGLTVFQHRAFITQLPAGEYLSDWVSTTPGFPDVSAVVRLIITPAS